MPKKITDEICKTPGEVLDVLKREESKRELSLFQKRALEYMKKVAKIDGKEEAKLIKRLLKLEDVTEEEAIQIVNLMPKSREELKTIFYHRKAIIMSDFLDKILQTLKESEE